MRPIGPAIVLAAGLLALAGCAKDAAPPCEPATAAPAPASPPVAALGGPTARSVELPPPVGPGEPREVHVLVDEPAGKLVTIVLRKGTVLPEHRSPVAVTIQALQGSGTVSAGGERLRLDARQAVVLAPGVPHAVEPDAGADLVLLVHHLGRAKAGEPGGGEHHHGDTEHHHGGGH